MKTILVTFAVAALLAVPARAAELRIFNADAKIAAKAILEAAPGDVVVEGVHAGWAGLFLASSPEWCVVSRVVPGGAAAAAGLSVGDEIRSLGGVTAFGKACPDLESKLTSHIGLEVPVRYVRAGRSYETKLVLTRQFWPIDDDADRCRAARATWHNGAVIEALAKAGLTCAMYEHARVLTTTKRERDAATWYQKAAVAGHPEAMFQAYRLELLGRDVRQDHVAARRHLSSAAAAGYGPALAELARFTFSGAPAWGIRQDAAAARALLLAAGAKGEALTDLAAKHRSGEWGFPKDEAEVFRWYARAAWKGDLYSSGTTAKDLYEKGVVPADDPEAYRFYVAYGVYSASKRAAWLLLSGEMGPKDPQAALGIYKAISYDMHSQLAAGWMLVMGEGVEKDPVAAKALFEKVAGHYDTETKRWGANNLAWLYLNGEGVDKDESKAFGLFPESGMGAYNKGVMYEHGIWEQKDLIKAYEQYARAAESDPVSMVRMGDVYMCRPACVPSLAAAPDAKTAVGFYRRAAEKGDPIAQQRMGELYEKGLAVTKDLRQAAVWYKRSAAYRGVDPSRNRLDPSFLLRVEPDRVLGTAGGEDLAAMRAAAARKAAQLMSQAAGTESYRAHDARLKSDADQPTYRVAEKPEDFAVVVGVESYPNLPPAEFAERDAKAVREHVRALGVPERNLVFLSGRDASRAGLAKNLETWLPMNVKEGSTVWFYFSGHGAPDPTSGDAYLVPADGDPQFLKDTAYPLKRLYEKLGALKAKRVLVALDACFSGVGERSLLAKGTRPLVSKVELGGLPDKVVALTASDGSEVSGTLESQGHGLFTYFLLKGLNGGALGKDGAVTWKGLHEWLTPRVQDEARRQNRLQTPRLLGDAAEVRLR